MAEQANVEQRALWSGDAGRAWVETQEVLDRLFAPFEGMLVDAASAGERILDVGCGTGGTTVAMARRVGGGCVGVDVSDVMIDAARARGGGVDVSFVCADAQRHPFEPGGFDAVASRFGVMFFDDPTAAFANLRAAAAPGAALRCIAWRSAGENPFMTAAERAAAPLLAVPARDVDPRAPGQFAFADDGYVRSILDRAGWSAVDVRPIDVACAMAAASLAPYLVRLGPVGRALAGVDPQTRARVVEAVRPAFDPYVRDGEVRFTAACWWIGATA